MKVNNQPKTSDRNKQIKIAKNIHFGQIAGSVANLATKQRNAKVIPAMATHDQTYKGQTNICTTKPFRYPTSMSLVIPPALIQQIKLISNSHKKFGIKLAVK